MRRRVMALLLGAAWAGSALAAPVQWTVASGGNDHWYEYVSGPLTWGNARSAALAASFNGLQGYLATLLSAAENTFAAGVAGGVLSWAGGSDQGVEGQWVWMDGPEAGQAFTFTNWNPDEPNNCCGGEDYLQTNFGASGVWNDDGGPGNGGQMNGYIIEYSVTSIPEPQTLALMLPTLLAAGYASRRRRT